MKRIAPSDLAGIISVNAASNSSVMSENTVVSLRVSFSRIIGT